MKRLDGKTVFATAAAQGIGRATVERMAAEGARVLSSGEPTIGAHGKTVLILHPKDFVGTLVELQQA